MRIFEILNIQNSVNIEKEIYQQFYNYQYYGHTIILDYGTKYQQRIPSQIMPKMHNLSPASGLVLHLDEIGQNDCLDFSYIHYI